MVVAIVVHGLGRSVGIPSRWSRIGIGASVRGVHRYSSCTGELEATQVSLTDLDGIAEGQGYGRHDDERSKDLWIKQWSKIEKRESAKKWGCGRGFTNAKNESCDGIVKLNEVEAKVTPAKTVLASAHDRSDCFNETAGLATT